MDESNDKKEEKEDCQETTGSKRNRIEEIESQLEFLKVELVSLRSQVNSESRKRQKLEEVVANIFEGKKEEGVEVTVKEYPKLFTKSSSPWNTEDEEWMEHYVALASVEDANDFVVDRPRSQMTQWVAFQFQRQKADEMEDYQSKLFEEIGVDWKKKNFKTKSVPNNNNNNGHTPAPTRGRPKGSHSSLNKTNNVAVEINYPGQEHYNQVAEVISKNHSAWCWVWFKWAILNDDVMRAILEAPSTKEELKIYLNQIPQSKFPPWARGQTESRDKFVEEIYFWYRQVCAELKGIKLKKAELANDQSGDGAVQLFESSSSSQSNEVWGLLLPLPAEQIAYLRSIEQQYPSNEKLVVLYQTEKEAGLICGPLALIANDSQSKNTISSASPFPSHKNRKFFGREVVKLEMEEDYKKGRTISAKFPSWIEV